MGTCIIEKIECDLLSEGLEEVFINIPGRIATQFLPTNKKEDLKQGFLKITLGKIFDIKIGIVLGATKLLTYANQNLDKNPYYPDFLYPVITKGKQLQGLSISPEKLLLEISTPVLLVDAIKMEQDSSDLFSNFLNSIPNEVLLNDTFRNRKKLFEYDDYKHPDAFLTFYSQKLPRVIVNQEKSLNCTNSVHRLYLKDKYKGSPIFIKFISLQLYAGIFNEETLSKARQYGNKIKKYEPSDAANIPVLLPETENEVFVKQVEYLFDQISSMIENEKITEAKSILDDYFLNNVFCGRSVELFVA